MNEKFKVPYTLILLLSMMVVAYLATWLVPQGFFEMVTLENGSEALVAGTYALTSEQIRL
ncbi:MAG: putative ion transporter superfamily protein YfcC [Flavobacteriales bacterium]|jgi:uncharacterized ion transporter superfamily protein YfcC